MGNRRGSSGPFCLAAGAAAALAFHFPEPGAKKQRGGESTDPPANSTPFSRNENAKLAAKAWARAWPPKARGSPRHDPPTKPGVDFKKKESTRPKRNNRNGYQRIKESNRPPRNRHSPKAKRIRESRRTRGPPGGHAPQEKAAPHRKLAKH